MDITLQGDGRIGMAQDLGQRLDFKSHLDRPGGEGVPEGVGMDPLQPTGPGVFLNTVLQRPRLHVGFRAGEDVCAGV